MKNPLIELKRRYLVYIYGENFNTNHRFLKNYAHGVILDIGANRGDYSLFFAMRGATVHAFEPIAACCFKIQKKTNYFKNSVTVHNCGVSDQVGSYTFWEDMTIEAESSFSRESVGKFACPVEVTMRTIDSFFFKEKISFIKIDTQGYDYKVLRGRKKPLNGIIR